MANIGDTSPVPFAVAIDEHDQSTPADMALTPTTNHNDKSSSASGDADLACKRNNTDVRRLILLRFLIGFVFGIVIFAFIFTVTFLGGNNGGKTTTNYYPSFVSFCSSVMDFYATEQPDLKCFCDDTSMHVECQGSCSGDDIIIFAEDVNGNVTVSAPSITTGSSKNSTEHGPLSVMVLEYNSSDGSYKTALCECETEHCESENKSLASKSKRLLRSTPTLAPVTPGVREKDGKPHSVSLYSIASSRFGDNLLR
jgi:hypothetical protein